jgi:quinol monooxygenase YgiN
MAYLLVRHTAEDYSKWRPVFDDHEGMRKAGGSKSARVFRNADNPNEIVLLMEWDDVENARRFASSDDLRQAMERAGVVGRPEALFLEEA